MAPQPIKARSEPDVISVLAVLSPETYRELSSLLGHTSWKLQYVRTVQQAVAELSAQEFPIVLCDATLSDGTWRYLLAELRRGCQPFALIVVSPSADHRLWAEVINLGGYDILMRPFDGPEVYNVITGAWRSLKNAARLAQRTGDVGTC